MPPVGFEPKISAGERPAAARLHALFQNRGLRRVNGFERGEISSITMKTATFGSARVRRVRDTCILFGKNGSVETTRGPAFRQT